MTARPPLPPGLATRPLVVDDAAAVQALMAAQQQVDVGRVDIEVGDLLADWQRPSTDLDADSVLVLDDAGTPVGYAELVGVDRYDAAVDPARRGEGVGTWLAAWVRDRVRERGGSIVGMPVPQGSAGDRLLTDLGYHVRWTSWQLVLPSGATVADRPLPPGYRLRRAEEADHHAVWTVVEDAFLEWSDRARQTFEDFAAQVVRRPGFEPWHLLVVTDPDDAVVGVSLGWNVAGRTDVARLAVRGDQRGRGLAQSLLVAHFAEGRRHGATEAGLSTDSRTGALGLYERVGMVVEETWLHRAVHLGGRGAGAVARPRGLNHREAAPG